jgi:hypothetical protein
MKRMLRGTDATKVVTWLLNAHALPGRASLLARDKTIIAVVGIANLSAVELDGVTWGKADAVARPRVYRGAFAPEGTTDIVRGILLAWRGTLESAKGRPLLDTEPMFPLLQPVRSMDPLRSMGAEGLRKVVWRRLREAGLPEQACSVRRLRACLVPALIEEDGTPANWTTQLTPLHSSPSSVDADRGRVH